MIIEIIKSIILGTTEGITEFLPVSSTGHLVILNEWFYFEKDFTFLFDIFIQLGAILAVLFFFREKILPLRKKSEGEKKDFINLWLKVFTAILPAIVIGLLFKDFIEEKLFNTFTVAITLIIGGIIILIAENINKKVSIEKIQDLSFKKSLAIGFCQCIAMIPGVSRAGATIIGGLFLGLNRNTSTEFSFFLAIPTMLLASTYSLLKTGINFDQKSIMILTTGFVVAFLSALLVIKIFIKYIQNNNFKIFGYYRIILGILIILFFI